MLQKLPKESQVCTAGMEGIYPAEVGNLFPLKVLQTRSQIILYIDDGVGEHGAISDNWEPLDEFLGIDHIILQ